MHDFKPYINNGVNTSPHEHQTALSIPTTSEQQLWHGYHVQLQQAQLYPFSGNINQSRQYSPTVWQNVTQHSQPVPIYNLTNSASYHPPAPQNQHLQGTSGTFGQPYYVGEPFASPPFIVQQPMYLQSLTEQLPYQSTGPHFWPQQVVPSPTDMYTLDVSSALHQTGKEKIFPVTVRGTTYYNTYDASGLIGQINPQAVVHQEEFLCRQSEMASSAPQSLDTTLEERCSGLPTTTDSQKTPAENDAIEVTFSSDERQAVSAEIETQEEQTSRTEVLSPPSSADPELPGSHAEETAVHIVKETAKKAEISMQELATILPTLLLTRGDASSFITVAQPTAACYPPCVSSDFFLSPSQPQELRQLDSNIQLIFLSTSGSERDKKIDSLTLFMSENPDFKDKAKAYKKAARGKARVNKLSPKEYLHKVITLNGTHTKTVNLQFRTGNLKPFIVPCYANNRLCDFLQKTDHLFKETFGQKNLSRMLDGEKILFNDYMPIFQIMMETFCKKIDSFMGKTPIHQAIAVTHEDLLLHVDFSNHFLLRSLATYRHTDHRYQRDANHHMMTIINCHLAISHAIYQNLSSNRFNITQHQREILARLFMDTVRAQIALLSHDDFCMVKLVTYWRQSSPPEEAFSANEHSKRHLITQKNIQSALLDALMLTHNDLNYQQHYFEVIRLISRSYLFSPIDPRVHQKLKAGSVQEQGLAHQLFGQTKTMSLHIGCVISRMNQLIMDGPQGTPDKFQHLLGVFKNVWLPPLTCNIQKLSGRPFSLKPPHASESQLSEELDALEERQKGGNTVATLVAPLIQSMQELVNLMNKKLLTEQELEAQLVETCQTLAKEIGDSVVAGFRAKSEQKTDKSKIFESESKTRESSPPPHEQLAAVEQEPLLSSPSRGIMPKIFEKADQSKTLPEILCLIEAELSETERLPTQEFTIYSEFAFRYFQTCKPLYAEVRVGTPLVCALEERTRTLIEQKKVPDQIPEEHAAYQWLHDYFPKKDLLSKNMVALLDKVRPTKIEQVKQSAKAIHTLLDFALNKIQPFIHQDNLWTLQEEQSSDHTPEILPSREYVDFMMKQNERLLEEVIKAREAISTKVQSNSLLENRINILDRLGLGRNRISGTKKHEPNPHKEKLHQLVIELKNNKSKLEEHNNNCSKPLDPWLIQLKEAYSHASAR